LSQASLHFEAITRQLIHLGRYIVLDLGCSLTMMVEKVIALCNEIIVVVEPVPQTITQTKALIADLVEKGVVEDCISVVLVNRLRSGMHLSWSQVQDQLSRPIGVIFTPAPELAYQASINTTPMIVQQPDSLTTQQFAKLAEKVAVHSRPVVS
jgi:MinD-like ATPase involved in chromosome partitioning or flagellar assembly